MIFDDPVNGGQQIDAAGILVRRIRIRKMLADITQSRGPQQRITSGVQQHIRIRVSQKPFVKGNRDPTQNKLAARNQPMDIVTQTNACHAPTAFFDPVQKCIHKDGFNTILDICRKAAAGSLRLKKGGDRIECK